MRQNKFIVLRDLIREYINQPVLRSMYTLNQLRKNWNTVVSQQAAEHTRPYKISRKKLYVAADNSIWITELRFQKNEIVSLIKEKYTNLDIRDIQFIVKSPLKR